MKLKLSWIKGPENIKQLREDYNELDLSEIDLELCKLSKKLTFHPHTLNEESDIKPLKKLGLSDRVILDATLVISYFNFVNRMVLGLSAILIKSGLSKEHRNWDLPSEKLRNCWN